MECELCETQDAFREAMFAFHGMAAAFETKVRGMALYEGFDD